MGNLTQELKQKVKIVEQLEAMASSHPEWYLEVADSIRGQASRPESRKTVMQAVIDYLQEHGPSISSEIIAGVCSEMETRSRSPEAVVHSTLNAMKKSGKLTAKKNSDGRWSYSLPKTQSQ